LGSCMAVGDVIRTLSQVVNSVVSKSWMWRAL